MVKFSSKPAFEPDDDESVGEPKQSPQGDQIVKKMRKRQIDFLEHAKKCVPSMSEKELEEMFSAVMHAYHNQAVFKCIAVAPPAPDGVCEVSFHNDIPRLKDGRYISSNMAVHGHYIIPHIKQGFPGMAATGKGAVFGDPYDEMNDEVFRNVSRAKVPKGQLRDN